MRYFRCPYCEADLSNWHESYCPECRAVLGLSEREMQRERIRLLHNEARAAIANEEWRLAINNLVTILKIDPENGEIRELLKHARRNERLNRHYLEGELHYRARRWEKSLASLEKVQHLDPRFKDVGVLIEQVKKAQRQDREEQRRKKRPAEPLIRVLVYLLLFLFILLLLAGIGVLIYAFSV